MVSNEAKQRPEDALNLNKLVQDDLSQQVNDMKKKNDQLETQLQEANMKIQGLNSQASQQSVLK